MSIVGRLSLIAGLALAVPIVAFAQANDAALKQEVNAADAAYWKAYNSCDYAKLDALTAENVEFYHDKGGTVMGRAALTDSVRKNICGDPNGAVLREAGPKDTQTFLLNRGPEVYGALVGGQHQFFAIPKAGGKIPTGTARFQTLWLRKDNAWIMSRVFSYDHQPAAYTNERKAVKLSSAELEQFTGSYQARIQPLFVFKRDGGNLSVDVQGRPNTFYPMSKTSFFLKEMDIVVDFKPATGGKSAGFSVRQNGALIDEAVRQ